MSPGLAGKERALRKGLWIASLMMEALTLCNFSGKLWFLLLRAIGGNCHVTNL